MKDRKEADEGDSESIPLKVKRLRNKRDAAQKRTLNNLLRDSRSASEIAKDAEENDLLLEY